MPLLSTARVTPPVKIKLGKKNLMDKQSKQKNYQSNDKKLVHVLKPDKRLSEALRKNLKRRRARKALIASN